MKKLVKYEKDIYRMGSLEYINTVDEYEWNILEKAMKEGVSIYLHEYFGKHSEVKIKFEPGDFSILSEKQEEIEFFDKMFSCYVGNCNILEKLLDREYEEEK